MKNIMQFIKFAVVGGSNTFIGLAVYYALLWVGAHYLCANTVSWVISVFNAFYWNNRYVFKNDVYWVKALGKTYASYGISFIIGMILMYMIVDGIGMSDKLAPIVTICVTTPLNFFMNKFWTFRNVEQRKD